MSPDSPEISSRQTPLHHHQNKHHTDYLHVHEILETQSLRESTLTDNWMAVTRHVYVLIYSSECHVMWSQLTGLRYEMWDMDTMPHIFPVECWISARSAKVPPELLETNQLRWNFWMYCQEYVSKSGTITACFQICSHWKRLHPEKRGIIWKNNGRLDSKNKNEAGVVVEHCPLISHTSTSNSQTQTQSNKSPLSAGERSLIHHRKENGNQTFCTSTGEKRRDKKRNILKKIVIFFNSALEQQS